MEDGREDMAPAGLEADTASEGLLRLEEVATVEVEETGKQGADAEGAGAGKFNPVTLGPDVVGATAVEEMAQGLLGEREARTEGEEGMWAEEADGMEAGAEEIGPDGMRADAEGAGAGSLDSTTPVPDVAGGTDAEDMASGFLGELLNGRELVVVPCFSAESVGGLWVAIVSDGGALDIVAFGGVGEVGTA